MKEKTFSDPLEPLSEDANRAMLGYCEELAKDASDAMWMMDDIVRRAEENIRLWNDNNKYARLIRKAYECKFGKPKEKDIMKEKKTRIMTKAEAFGYLTYKKVACYNQEVDVQKKLFEIGFKWCDGTTVEVVGLFDFLLIDDGTFQFTDNVSHFRKHAYEEISADDILSIEIVDEKKKSEEEEALDKISCLGAQIADILLRMKGHHHVTITETTVALHGEGMSLFHSDPF